MGDVVRFLLAAVITAGAIGNAFGSQLDRDEVFELQYRLDQLGYQVGEPDGKLGSSTRKFASEFARSEGIIPTDLRHTLDRAREKTKGIEGWTRKDGQIELLVLTDEGSALVVRVAGWGLIRKGRSETYTRGYDRDGRVLLGEHFEVLGMERVALIPLKPWQSFGYKIFFPTPPKGERLEIEQALTRPVINDDGTVVISTSVYRNAFLKRPESSPWFWYNGLEENADARLTGEWTMTLGQKGTVLFSRTFTVQRQ